ncbi:photosystem II reaction center protein PsbZ [Prochlorococcus sp. MIT 1300]|uniref:photosystem II reaction center protein PsbZ n=1 Tax=Prochlorococcus sp. MIT 1300 TaxID=3096218 RepID=UPI002A7520DF|nr:photosystem II reaction center protein PsbZ [Prochlorococcus sp. MIT 1300]
MQFISFIAANALLFASLILVVGVPVLYMTQNNPEDRRNREIRAIEVIGGVWFHLVLINGIIAFFVV